MRIVAALLLASLPGMAQNTASTRNRCSPAISEAGGSVTITYESGSCVELDAKTVATLKAFVEKFPKTIDRLNELLDKKDVELAQRGQEIQDWIAKYTDLERQLGERAEDSELSRQAAQKLQEGDLTGAGRLLDEVISRGEAQLDRLAQDHFNRGVVFDLEFRWDRAVEHYERAARLRPEKIEYTWGYGTALQRQNRHVEATGVYEKLGAELRGWPPPTRRNTCRVSRRRSTTWGVSTEICSE